MARLIDPRRETSNRPGLAGWMMKTLEYRQQGQQKQKFGAHSSYLYILTIVTDSASMRCEK